MECMKSFTVFKAGPSIEASSQFHARLLCPKARLPIKQEFGWVQSRCGCGGEAIDVLYLSEIELRVLGRCSASRCRALCLLLFTVMIKLSIQVSGLLWPVGYPGFGFVVLFLRFISTD